MILHKNETYTDPGGTTVSLATDTRDLHYGKYDSGMAVYLHDRLMNGSEGVESASDSEGSGSWAERYGRRILSGDDRGFIYAETFENEDEARERFALFAQSCYCADCEPDEDEDEPIIDGADAACYHPSER